MNDAAADPSHPLRHKRVLHTVADELTGRFAGVSSLETVERCVFDSYAVLAATATVPNHLATLTNKFAADRLVAAAQTPTGHPVGVRGGAPRPARPSSGRPSPTYRARSDRRRSRAESPGGPGEISSYAGTRVA